MSEIKKFGNFKSDVQINEAFTNDVNWGDSLLGRLINSTVRKAKIAVNLKKIDNVLKSVEEKFEELVNIGKIGASPQDIIYLNLSTYFGLLKSQVENGEKKEILIQTTDECINFAKQYDNYSDNNFKVSLLDALDEFKKYLKELSSDSIDDSDVEGGDNSTNVDTSNINDILKDNSISMLQSVVRLHNDIKSGSVKKVLPHGAVKKVGDTSFSMDKFKQQQVRLKSADSKNYNSILFELIKMSSKGKLYAQSQKDSKLEDEMNKLYLDYTKSFSTRVKNNISNKIKGFDAVKSNGIIKEFILELEDKFDFNSFFGGKEFISKLKAECKPSSLTMRENLVQKFDSVFEATMEVDEKDSRNAWSKVVNAYNSSGISKQIPEIEKLLSLKLSDGKEEFLAARKRIKNICKQVVSNKSTIGKPISLELLIKEEQSSDNDIIKSISLFSKILIAFKEDIGLLGSYGFVGKNIKTFIDSFSKIESILPKLKISENNYLHKNGFKLIVEKQDYSDDVFNKFKEIFYDGSGKPSSGSIWIDVEKQFSLTSQQIEEYKGKKSEKMTIVINPVDDKGVNNTDPIIEIVKLFHRAYRIHTPGRIPSGRTDGRVSNKTFSEYEFVGSGSEGSQSTPGNGPYRNIKLYDKWYNGILNIKSNAKYRQLFSSETIIKVGDGDPIPEGGKVLMRFIVDLLDSKMYGSSRGEGGGALSSFMEKYFLLDSNASKKAENYFKDTKDGKSNADVVKELNPEIKYKFTPMKLDEFLKGFKKGVINEKNYFKIKDVNGNEYQLQFIKVKEDTKNKNFGYFIYSSVKGRTILNTSVKLANPISQVDMNSIKIGRFEKPLTKKFTISYIGYGEDDTVKSDEVDIKEVFKLVSDDGDGFEISSIEKNIKLKQDVFKKKLEILK